MPSHRQQKFQKKSCTWGMLRWAKFQWGFETVQIGLCSLKLRVNFTKHKYLDATAKCFPRLVLDHRTQRCKYIKQKACHLTCAATGLMGFLTPGNGSPSNCWEPCPKPREYLTVVFKSTNSSFQFITQSKIILHELRILCEVSQLTP